MPQGSEKVAIVITKFGAVITDFRRLR